MVGMGTLFLVFGPFSLPVFQAIVYSSGFTVVMASVVSAMVYIVDNFLAKKQTHKEPNLSTEKTIPPLGSDNIIKHQPAASAVKTPIVTLSNSIIAKINAEKSSLNFKRREYIHEAMASKNVDLIIKILTECKLDSFEISTIIAKLKGFNEESVLQIAKHFSQHFKNELFEKICKNNQSNLIKLMLNNFGSEINNEVRSLIIQNMAKISKYVYEKADFPEVIKHLLDDPMTNISYDTQVNALKEAENPIIFIELFKYFSSVADENDKENIFHTQVKKLNLESVMVILKAWESSLSLENKKAAIKMAATKKGGEKLVNVLLNYTGIQVDDLNEFPPNIKNVFNNIQNGNEEMAIELINQLTAEELNQPFYYQLKNTTLLCEAALSKSVEIVKALLSRNADMHVNLPGYQYESVLERLIWSPQFDDKSVSIGQLLIQKGIKLGYSHCSTYCSILDKFYFDYADQQITSKNSIEQCYNLIMQIMGDKFFDELLRLPSHNERTALKSICSDKDSKCPAAYEFLVEKLISYLDNKSDIDEKILAGLLLSSRNEDKVIQFVKTKLAQTKTNADDINQNTHSVFIETNYSNRSVYFHPDFKLFNYENEKQAFKCALENSILSLEQIEKVHHTALGANDETGVCLRNTRSGTGRVGYNCSIGGFFEIKACGDKGWFWFDLSLYGSSFDEFIFYPKGDKEHFEQIINDYNQNMTKNQPRIEKLKNIIKLGSDLSRLHYYRDANKRTSYITFLMELIRNQFLPAMTSKRLERADFRIKAQHELLPLVLHGMKKSLKKLSSLDQQATDPTLTMNTVDFYKEQLDNLAKAIPAESLPSISEDEIAKYTTPAFKNTTKSAPLKLVDAPLKKGSQEKRMSM